MMKFRFVTRVLLVVTLCVCLCVVPSFGPRLSVAEGFQGGIIDSVTQTDFLPSQTSPQSVTVQTKNILSAVSLAYGTVDDLRFHMSVFPYSGIANTTFCFYDYNPTEAEAITAVDNVDSTGKLVVTYDPNENRPSGVPFLLCGYNTTDDVGLAKS